MCGADPDSRRDLSVGPYGAIGHPAIPAPKNCDSVGGKPSLLTLCFRSEVSGRKEYPEPMARASGKGFEGVDTGEVLLRAYVCAVCIGVMLCVF